MDTEPIEQGSFQISQATLLAFVRAIMGGGSGREDDDHPLPPGPWDPIVRAALERFNAFGPRPEPWKGFFGRRPDLVHVIGGGPRFGDEVALNPQPLPPRFAFLVSVAQSMISRAEMLQEVADATRREGEEQGIIIVSGYVGRFVDEFCGTGFKLRYPFPGPRPHWFANELDGIDLVVMGAQFDQAAKETFNPDLRQSLAEAGAKFVATGLSKLQ